MAITCSLLEEKKDSCGRRSIPWAMAFRAYKKVPMESLSALWFLLLWSGQGDLRYHFLRTQRCLAVDDS